MGRDLACWGCGQPISEQVHFGSEHAVEFAVAKSMLGTAALLTPTGEVDLTTAGPLREDITAAIDSGAPAVLIDLSGITFIDSTGLGALIDGLNYAGEHHVGLELVSPSPGLTRLLEITGLQSVFTIRDSLPPFAH